ncbi:MAG: hypothetical protein EOP34_03715 [Rickettsiales bacterium]|nr:MAG: hypothetical protein EOP34_03715 [Rickettsiales bacterium]
MPFCCIFFGQITSENVKSFLKSVGLKYIDNNIYSYVGGELLKQMIANHISNKPNLFDFSNVKKYVRKQIEDDISYHIFLGAMGFRYTVFDESEITENLARIIFNSILASMCVLCNLF